MTHRIPEGVCVGNVEGLLLGSAVGSAASQRAHPRVRGPRGKTSFGLNTHLWAFVWATWRGCCWAGPSEVLPAT
jgi:hypothetical protein